MRFGRRCSVAALALVASTKLAVQQDIEWRVTPRVSLVMTGQNLTDDVHVEFGGLENATTVTLDPRRVTGKLTWRY